MAIRKPKTEKKETTAKRTQSAKKLDEKDLAAELEQAEKETKQVRKRGLQKPADKKAQEKDAPAKDSKKGKVTNIADKKAEKAAEKKLNREKAEQKAQAKAQKEAEEREEAEWNELFDEVIKGRKFNYVRQDKVTLKELNEHLASGQFDVHLLMAEGREDGKFSNFVMCFVSKETVTFIDQTGGEDYDTIVQIPHDDLNKRSIHYMSRRKAFPIAIYFKTAK